MYEEFSQLVLQREEGVSQQKLKIKTTVPLEKKKGGRGHGLVGSASHIIIFHITSSQWEDRDILFEFHLKYWNTASIGIPVRTQQ